MAMTHDLYLRLSENESDSKLLCSGVISASITALDTNKEVVPAIRIRNKRDDL